VLEVLLRSVGLANLRQRLPADSRNRTKDRAIRKRSISGVTTLKGTCWLALGALVAFVHCRYVGWNEPSFLLVVMLLWWYFSWRERRRRFIAPARHIYTVVPKHSANRSFRAIAIAWKILV